MGDRIQKALDEIGGYKLYAYARKSTHPDDWYLWTCMAIKESDGTYTVWATYNDQMKEGTEHGELHNGFYGLDSLSAHKLFEIQINGGGYKYV